MRRVKILGTGKYLPARKVTSEEIDIELGLPPGTGRGKSGVISRRYATHETASGMGAAAANEALKAAGLQASDLDAIIGTSGTQEQPIPYNGALIQRALGLATSGIPAFDVNSTCLSFVTGLDVASYMIHSGRFKRVLLVSTEIASCGLNPKHLESRYLFGDAAAAAVLGRAEDGDPSGVIASHMETYSEGADLCVIRGGGSKLHPRKVRDNDSEEFLFDMDGPQTFKKVLKFLPGFFDRLLDGSGVSLQSADLFVPHQASGTAMGILKRRLGIDDARWMDILADHGNVIAASIPLALHTAIEQGRLKRGNTCILAGTSAGLSIGGVVLRY